MKLYIFERVDQVSGRFYSDGGLVVIAPNRDAIKTIIQCDEYISLTDEEIQEAIELELKNDEVAPTFYVFPDAGYC